MGEKAKILVVDDDPNLLLVTSRTLRSAGYEVLEASTGRAGVAAAREKQPDLVLLDVVLPDVDGLEVCKQIKADPCCARTFVVLASSLRTDSESQTGGLEGGADGYIARPIPNSELLARVRSMLRIQQTEQALRDSEARFRTIVETAPSLLVITDAEGNNVYASPNCEEFLGCTQDELIGSPRWWVHEDDMPRALETYQRTLREGTGAKDFEYKAVRRNGEVWYASSSWEPFRDSKGEFRGVVLQTTDITKRKRSEEMLRKIHKDLEEQVRARTRELDERLQFERLLSELSATFIHLPSSAVDGEIERALRRLVENLGVDRGGVFQSAERTNDYRQTHAWSVPGRESESTIIEMERLPWIAERVARGEVVHFTRDDDLPPDAVTDRANLRAFGMRSFVIVPLAMGGAPFGALTLATVDREQLWSEDLLQRLRLAGDVFANALVRKRMEEDLRDKTRGLAEAQRTAHLGFWKWNVVTNDMHWSDEVCHILGLKPQQFAVTFEAFLEHVHPDDRAAVKQAVDAALADSNTRYSLEHRAVRPDGSERIVHGQAEVTFGEDGRPIGMMGTIQDITAHKGVERELRRSEELYRGVVEDQTELICRFTPDTKLTLVNEAYCRYFGKSHDELLGRAFLEFVPETEHAGIRSHLETFTPEKCACRYEHPVIRQDGSTAWQEWTDRAVFDEQGRVVEFQSVGRDITERKRAERRLRLSNRVFEIASRHTETTPLLQELAVEIQQFTACEAVGIRMLEKDSRIPYRAYLGFPVEFCESESPLSITKDECMCVNVVKGTTDPNLPFYTDRGSFWMNATTPFLASVSEDDKGSTRNICNQFGYESVALVPIRGADRVIGLIHIADPRENMVPPETLEALEEAAAQIGTVVERFFAEQELKIKNDAIESSISAVGITDLEGKLIYVNDALVKMWGYAGADEILGRLLPEFWEGEGVFETIAALRQKGGRIGEDIGKRKDGSLFPVQFSASMIKDKAGNPLYMYGSFVDITARKRAEEGLKENLYFETLLSGLSAAFINVPGDEIDREIERWLRRIVETIDVDRSIIFQQSDDGGHYRVTHAWAVPGCDPLPPAFWEDKSPWAAEVVVKRGEILRFSRIDDLPDEAESDREYFRANGPKSCVVIPLMVEGQALGVVSFATVRRERTWPENLVQRLRLVAEVFANALARKRMEQVLRGKTEGLAKAQQIAHLGFWNWNIVKNELFWSEEVYRIFGQRPGAFGATYEAFLDSVHPDDREAVTEAVDKALADPDEQYSIEHRVVRPDGSECTVHERAEVTFDDEGRAIRMIGTVQDITERKRAEEALRKSEQRFRRVLNTSPDAVALVQRDGVIVFASEPMVRMFGYERETLIGRGIEMLVPERFRHPHARHRADYFHDPRIRPMGTGRDLYGLRRDGSEFPCEISLSPLEAEEDTVVLCHVRDISERRRNEEEVEKLRADLAHVARTETMGELAASLAHEINQPLTAILSNAQAAQRFLAAEDPDLDEVRGALADIIDNDWRAGEVIRKMRALLKKGDLEKVPQDVNKLIEEVVPLVRGEALARDVVMELDLAEALPPVSGDRVQLQQIILNLAVNGMEAMSDVGAGQRRLVIRTSQCDSECVEIAVRDWGSGLAPETVDRIFDPFYTTKPEGMGMGLSISVSIVEAHNGRLWAENNSDRGMTFHVILPVGGKGPT